MESSLKAYEYNTAEKENLRGKNKEVDSSNESIDLSESKAMAFLKKNFSKFLRKARNNDRGDNLKKSKVKGKGKCHECGEAGHFMDECPKRPVKF